jgi:hypothetical protein
MKDHISEDTISSTRRYLSNELMDGYILDYDNFQVSSGGA